MANNCVKVFVTGASGFIGRNLVKSLGNKHAVYGLFRDEQKSKESDNITALLAVLTDKNSIVQALQGIEFDVIYHLAAVSVFDKNKDLQRKVNVNGTKNLAESINQSSLWTFVYGSGLGVYGNAKGGWIDENTPIAPHTSYARIRLEAEQFLHKSGLPTLIARFGEVYGDGGWYKDFVIKRLREGSFRIPGDGSYYRSFVHVSDVVRGLELIGERKLANETIIIVDNEPATFKEFIYFTVDKIGVPRPGKVPKFVASVAAGGDLVKLLTTSIRAKNTRATQMLGWEPQDLSYRNGINQLKIK